MGLNLVHVRGGRSPSKGPVVLVHGAGVRANIFMPPTKKTLVDMLVGEGWDVWLENWRASIDIAPNQWTLDQAAIYDHPAAVQKVARLRREVAIGYMRVDGVIVLNPAQEEKLAFAEEDRIIVISEDDSEELKVEPTRAASA
jgi:hypothetical protein